MWGESPVAEEVAVVSDDHAIFAVCGRDYVFVRVTREPGFFVGLHVEPTTAKHLSNARVEILVNQKADLLG